MPRSGRSDTGRSDAERRRAERSDTGRCDGGTLEGAAFDGGALDGAVGAELDVVLDDGDARLRDLVMRAGVGGVAEAVVAQAEAEMAEARAALDAAIDQDAA